MAKVVKSPRIALLGLVVVLLAMVFLTTTTVPAYAATCTSSMTNCNSWAWDGTCCSGGTKQHQKRTCCDWQQNCCTQARCSTVSCPI